MPDINAAVCDTHALLYHAARDRRLGPNAAALFASCEDRAAIIYVPAAVVWEVSLLARRGRVRLGRSLAAFAGDLFSNPAYQSYDLTLEQIVLADEYRPSEDPFDALVVAAARVLGLRLITRDRQIVAAGVVPTVW